MLLPQRSIAQTSSRPFAASTPAVEPQLRPLGSGITCRSEYGFGRSLTGESFTCVIPACTRCAKLRSAIAEIAGQVKEFYADMEVSDIPAGSTRALRLFN